MNSLKKREELKMKNKEFKEATRFCSKLKKAINKMQPQK